MRLSRDFKDIGESSRRRFASGSRPSWYIVDFQLCLPYSDTSVMFAYFNAVISLYMQVLEPNLTNIDYSSVLSFSNLAVE